MTSCCSTGYLEHYVSISSGNGLGLILCCVIMWSHILVAGYMPLIWYCEISDLMKLLQMQIVKYFSFCIQYWCLFLKVQQPITHHWFMNWLVKHIYISELAYLINWMLMHKFQLNVNLYSGIFLTIYLQIAPATWCLFCQVPMFCNGQ